MAVPFNTKVAEAASKVPRGEIIEPMIDGRESYGELKKKLSDIELAGVKIENPREGKIPVEVIKTESLQQLIEENKSKMKDIRDSLNENTKESTKNEIEEKVNDGDDVSDGKESPKIACNDVGKNCPIENGTWDGERGNSKWNPDLEYVPQKRNPEQKTWEEILDENGIDGIDFKDGEPDFGEISKGNVEIESFSTERDDNFDKADIKLAEQKGCSPEDVAKWRKENGYTWHECKDMKTMQKVPSVVHNNISHRGGISEAKGGSQ